MARPRGSLNWKTKQKYLHDKYPDQGWMDETSKEVIIKEYQLVKDKEEDDKDEPNVAD